MSQKTNNYALWIGGAMWLWNQLANQRVAMNWQIVLVAAVIMLGSGASILQFIALQRAKQSSGGTETETASATAKAIRLPSGPVAFAARYDAVKQLTELAKKCRAAAEDTHTWITLHDSLIGKDHGPTDAEGASRIQEMVAHAGCDRLKALATQCEELAEKLIQAEG
ncbi:MAG TPA: hypothetical protein VMV15_10510 [Candidatus Binataceae bacterium]|nr:hypothetical protein [Candidatus Binataceae bacterium]